MNLLQNVVHDETKEVVLKIHCLILIIFIFKVGVEADKSKIILKFINQTPLLLP